ncbi:MAG: hypothetical protein SPD56_06085 [Alloprevotella sp.]|nr:hypothetical protein [Alloprevotella sp.]
MKRLANYRNASRFCLFSEGTNHISLWQEGRKRGRLASFFVVVDSTGIKTGFMGLMAENSVLMTGPAGSETMNNKPPEATVWALGQRFGAATKRNEKYFSKNLQKDCHVHSLF